MQNDFIGLLAEDTHSLLVGLLAILKSGNCIVPISPGFPIDRIEFIVEDCRVKILLTDKTNYALAQQVARGSSCLARVICIDDIEFKSREKLNQSPKSPERTTKEDMDNPCYAIYTSGSTGKPKGVPITYSNLVPLLMWFHHHFRLGEHTRVLQNLSYTFDFGIFELLTTLLAGGSLYFFNKKALKDLNEYVDFIYLHQLNGIHTTPSFINNITGLGRKLTPLELVHLGGEPLSKKLVEETARVVGENCCIYNGYGPTETTINSSIFSLKVKNEGLMNIPDNIPIGEPSANNVIYILDAWGNFQPIGVTGELYIGGTGVAPGYLNKPELTAEKFNRSYRANKTYIFYRTGDLGRWLPNGHIEFFGRIDHQVKVRGFRIELGEIENCLLNHKKIKDCAVTVREGEKGNKYLCAYLVVRSHVEPGALREYLSEYLPDYMTPSFIVTIDKMPLTTSGKIDLRALPEPRLEAGEAGGLYIAPRDELEEKLAGLWAEVLGTEKSKISIDANFFELGGHSLKATLLAAKIHKEFQVKVSLAAIFKTPFIRGLAATIRETAHEKYISLEPVEKREYYPLSPAQKRLYVLQQMDQQGKGIAYNIPSLWLLEGVVDKEKFEYVFRKLIQRHESLRTAFDVIDEEPVQRIHENVGFQIEYFATDRHGHTRTFDLSKAPLLRVGLIKEHDNKHLLMLDMHHIISDGISMEIFVKEFVKLYGGEDLPSLKFQYKDYSQWQNSLVRPTRSNAMKAQEDYWIEKLAGDIPVLELPLDYPRPLTKRSQGDRLQFDIGSELTARIKQLTLETEATPFMLFLAVFNLLLSKLSNQEDIIVGSPIAGRFHHDLENIIGIFINTLALRNYPCAGKRFHQFLAEVKDNCLRAFENQYYPYEELVERVQVNRDLSRNPLFDVMLVLQNMGRSKIEIPGLALTPMDHHNHVSKFDIILTAVEETGRFEFYITYNTDLFKQETMHRFIEYFNRILGAVLIDIDLQIAVLDILSDEEREQLLYSFNDTARQYPAEKTLHQLFAEQVERTPDRVGLVGYVRQVGLTYQKLNKQADLLATLLIEKGVLADDIVGIKIERSLEMIIGLMGILKAGGAYMPIDPEYPRERIDYMLKDSNAKILINEKFFGESRAPRRGEPIKVIQKNPPCSANLAYIIYTSGSTGQPKGVIVEHRNAVNVVCWFAGSYRLRLGSHVLQMSDYTFDPSVNQVFGTLLHGGVLHIINKELLYHSEALRLYIDKHHIQVLNFVPLMLDELLGNGPRLRSVEVVLSGGEKLDETVKQRILDKGYALYNQYGPTETTIDALVSKCSEEKVTLGKPINNVKCFVFDKSANIVPMGVAGELYIGGVGVARGYLNRPELTAERFYRSNKAYMTNIIYKTGDLCRWLPAGAVEFLGRMDHQVKVRGYRIELEEIENCLTEFEGVKEAVVIMRQDEGMAKYLCAYITTESKVDLVVLRDRLALTLPAYMIPAHIVVLDKIPLTPNGKLNRSLLPAPEVGTADYIAPYGPLEETLAKLWQELLDNERIGREDNFFQWGGQSLKALRLANKISQIFNTRVDLTDVFRYPTVRGLAAQIEQRVGGGCAFIKPAEKKEYYPLSSMQMRLYLIYQSDKTNTAYNMPVMFKLVGHLEKERLVGIFRQLIQRHESFRTSFIQVKGEPVQRIHEYLEFEIEYFAADERSQIRTFDLSAAPLLRVGLIETGKEEYILSLDMHHIISDGISMGILIQEFMALFEGKALPLPQVQYKDYAQWQCSEAFQKTIKDAEVFWLGQFQGAPGRPSLKLPTDFDRPAVRDFSGAILEFELGDRETTALKQIAKEEETTLYMVLLALYFVLMARLSGQEDITVGTPVFGRQREELQNVIGMFVNTLALRNYPKIECPFRDFLREIKERTLNAFKYQDYPFEKLVEKVAANIDNSRNPLFDVMFTFQNLDIPELRIPGLELKPYPNKSVTAKFDLNLICIEKNEALLFTLEYSTKLFKADTIGRFAGYFKDIIAAILDTRDIKLGGIEMVLELSEAKSALSREAVGDFGF